MNGLQVMANVPKQTKSKKTSKTPEGKVKDKVREIFDNLGVYWFMPVTGGYNRSGIPDFIACCNGFFIAVETKSKHTRHGVTALQEQNIKHIKDQGGIALVINEDNLDELEKVLKELK